MGDRTDPSSLEVLLVELGSGERQPVWRVAGMQMHRASLFIPTPFMPMVCGIISVDQAYQWMGCLVATFSVSQEK